METSELLKKVRKIEIKMKGLSKHLFSGEYHSAFKGRGMSFSEVRNYQYGDDVRNIDWNVTARTGEPHIKIFEEERELTVILLVDISRSALFGTVEQFKSEIITEISALVAFSAITNNDKVGLILFTDQIELFIPAQKGKQHILRIIRELLDFQPQGQGTRIDKALEYFQRIIKKRSICFLVSDFLGQGYEEPLRVASRKHDLVGVRIADPAEAQLPSIGLVHALDAETGALNWIDTSSPKVRRAYADWYERNSQYYRSAFLKCGADNLDILTTESYTTALHQFFQKRSGA
jgi:uncharacterized protein (DUF58 family)